MAKENNNIPTGLYWQGKRTEVERISLPFQTIETINESRATREKEKDTLLRGLKKKEDPVWHNRLIWGDNKYVMASLLDEFAGKIDLIYIDPPFFTGTNQQIILRIGEEQNPLEKEPSMLEEFAYRNVWQLGKDSYFQWLFDRLTLISDLLARDGILVIRHDQYWLHYVKVIADQVFGRDCFRNEIIVNRIKKNVTAQGRISIPIATDTLLVYFKNPELSYYDIKTKLPETREGYWRAMDSAGIRKPPERLINGKIFYPPPGRHFTFNQEKVDQMLEQGKIRINPKTNRPEYWVDPTDDAYLDSNWTDIPGYAFSTGYPTENSEALLERVIKAGSAEDGLVADFFCGSGTTGAVAEKLGRRWIVADIGRYAIHTTRKRLLGIEGCKPFVVQNLGKYERQYWQGVTFNNRRDDQKPIYEYIKFILDLYQAEPITGCLWIHGKKGKNLIHVGAVDAPVTLSDIESAIAECKKMKQSSLDILGWEWEMGLHDVIQDIAKAKGINLSLKYIPREVMDPRAVAAGDITFYELAYLEIDVSRNKHGEFIVALKDFVIPNYDLIPEEVRSKIKKWSDYIDYWSIDWDFNNDTFHNMWQSYRTRKDRTLLLKSDPHLYETKGKHLIMIKVIDIFGNDTTRIAEVTS